jgi:two-component system, sporulation sensor kinase E
LKIKKLFDFSYESHIRLSLIFLILFLILLNFGTTFLFHQTKEVLKKETERELYSAALGARMIWEKTSQTNLRKSLLEFVFHLNLSQIVFLTSKGELLISSREILAGEKPHVFWGLKPEEIKKIQTSLKPGQSSKFFSDFYSDDKGNTFYSLYLPIESQRSSNDTGDGKKIWVMVEKEVSAFTTIEKLSRLNTWARTGGILIAALVTLFLIRSMLRPYKLMMKKAQEEKITWGLEKNRQEGGVEEVVKIFEQVIAELKKNEETLQGLYVETNQKAKNLESYNEYILKSIESGMIICDTEGRITRFNQSAQKILDIPESLALGKHYKTVLREKKSLCSLIEIALLAQKACGVPEVEMSKTGGENIWVGINTSTIKDHHGKMLGVAVLLTDLTEIKRLQKQITFQEKMAALGEMSSGLAHELRNSMGTILGFSKLLKKSAIGRSLPDRLQAGASGGKGGDAPPTESIVNSIFNEALFMESMLQRFLSFAKPFDLKIEKINLKNVMEECINSLEANLKTNPIEFDLKSEPNLPLILGDRLLLKQSFQNLIQNSIDAMPQGGRLSIDLSETKVYPQEKFIRVKISDTGCGIEKKDQEKIFHPFFTSKEKGTGLGLSLVKKIISLHQGEIEFESQINQGTTFKIYLPLKSRPVLTKVETEEDADWKHSLIVS